MPYSALQFQIFLECLHLLSHYAKIPFKLMHGFPIGPLKPLKSTFTPPNLLGANLHADVIHVSIADEIHLGHYSGPFTQEELEQKISPFCSSPLQVNVKEGAPGEPTKYQVCCHLSYKGKAQSSVNNKIDSDDFPTCWGKASDVTRGGKVWFSQVLKGYHLNPELDFRSGLTPPPECWTGPSVLVQEGLVQAQRGYEPRTGPL